MTSMRVHGKVTAVLVSALLVHSSVAAPLARAGFWEERRRTVSEKDALSPLASLSQALPLGDRVLNGFAQPHLPRRTASRKILPSWMARLSTPFAEVEDFSIAPAADPSFPLVLLVQDVHGLVEAQRNTSRLLEDLSRSYALRLVGLEGASGGFRHGVWRRAARPEDLSFAADLLLDRKLIGGAEHFALTAVEEPALWGVESEDSYLANVEAVRAAAPLRPAVDAYRQALAGALQTVRRNAFGPGLLALDRTLQDYAAGRVGLGDYVAALHSSWNVSGRTFPQTAAFLSASAMEKEVDFKQAEAERAALVGALVKALDKTALDSLVSLSLEHRSGRVSFSEYHGHLKSLAARAGMPLHRTPALGAYVQYALAVDRVRKDLFFEELSELERTAGEGLAASAEQKEALSLSRDARLLERLFDHAMTPQDWRLWESRRAAILRLNDRLAALGFDLPALSFPADLSVYERFYRSALARNHDLLNNFLAHVGRRPAEGGRRSVAVLVSGGFHTAGLRDLLAERKISYAVLTPRLTDIPAGDDYLDVFSRPPSSLERMVLGRAVFLKSQDPLADKPSKGQGHAAETVSKAAAILLLSSRLISDSASGEVSLPAARAAAEAHRPVAALEVAAVEALSPGSRVRLDLGGDARIDLDMVPGGAPREDSPLAFEKDGTAVSPVPALGTAAERLAFRLLPWFSVAAVTSAAVLAGFVGYEAWDLLSGRLSLAGAPRTGGGFLAMIGGTPSSLLLLLGVFGSFAAGSALSASLADLWRRWTASAPADLGTIMIVEDNVELSGGLARYARMTGWKKVILVDTFDEAVRRAPEADVVLSDNDLGDDLDAGMRLAERLNPSGHSPRVPFIIHSGGLDFTERVQPLLERGNISSFDVKPSNTRELFGRLRALSAHARENDLFRFLAMQDAPPPSAPPAAMLVFGGADLRVLEEAARLSRENPRARVVVSGGQGRLTRDLLFALARDSRFSNLFPAGAAPTEAQAMEAALKVLGVEPGLIARDDASTNTKENAVNSLEILAGMDDVPAGAPVLLLGSPLHLRRVRATADRAMEAAAKKFALAAHAYEIPRATGRSEEELSEMLAMAAGEVQRLREYGAKGDLTPVEIPADVQATYEALEPLVDQASFQEPETGVVEKPSRPSSPGGAPFPNVPEAAAPPVRRADAVSSVSEGGSREDVLAPLVGAFLPAPQASVPAAVVVVAAAREALASGSPFSGGRIVEVPAEEFARLERLHGLLVGLETLDDLFGVPPALRGGARPLQEGGELLARLYAFLHGEKASDASLAAIRKERELDFATLEDLRRMTTEFRGLDATDAATAGANYGAQAARLLETGAAAAQRFGMSLRAMESLLITILAEREIYSTEESAEKHRDALSTLLQATAVASATPFDGKAWESRAQAGVPNAHVIELAAPETPEERQLLEDRVAESLLRNEALFFTSSLPEGEAGVLLEKLKASVTRSMAGKDLGEYGRESLRMLEERLISNVGRTPLGLFDAGAIYRSIPALYPALKDKPYSVLFSVTDLALWDRSTLAAELAAKVLFVVGNLQVEAYTEKELDAVRVIDYNA